MKRKTVLMMAGMMMLSSLLGGGAATWFGSIRPAKAEPPQNEVRAQRFVVSDANWRQRATLSANPDGWAGLTISDQDGYPRVFAGSSAGGTSSFGFLDGRGHVRATMSLETSGKVGFYLGDFTNGFAQVRGQFIIGQDGAAALSLFDENGKQIYGGP